MIVLVMAWMVVIVFLVSFVIRRGSEGGALTLSYFLGLSLIHVPGIIPFWGASTDLFEPDETRLGFEITVIGMSAFVGGVLLAGRSSARRVVVTTLSLAETQALGALAWRMVVVGTVSYFLLLPLSFRVPSLTSLIAGLTTLLILGLWVVLYRARMTKSRRHMSAALAILPLLPTATLVAGGFIGYGVYWVLSVITFLFIIVRQRRWFYLTAPFAVFLGLSFFVTYMGQRAGIRELVWEEHAGLVDRVERVFTMVTNFQLFDPASTSHMAAVNARLNQNWLVGEAVGHHEEGLSDYAYGATVAPWALIPRALWPDKPPTGGGGQIVSDFTGIQFASGTSVGAGQVLEFYVNFGTFGVLAGFFTLGFTLMRLDRLIMLSLAAGDTRGLLLRAMPGLTLLQPGGNLLEILVACIAAYVGAHMIVSLGLFRLGPTVRSNRQMV